MQLFGSHKVAIQGAGKHTEELLKLIDVHRNIVCIIDNGRNGNMYDIPICKESNIHQYKYDLILNSSYVYREEFIKVCRKYCDYDQIIDIYQILEQRGYFIHQGFYGEELIEPCDFYGCLEAEQMKYDIIKQMESR